MEKLKSKVCGELLSRLNFRPILVDVGSSGGFPLIWKGVANRSIYVGFDPDVRDSTTTAGGSFHKAILINAALAPDKAGETPFYLTRSPYCSSTLRPNSVCLSDFLYADLFAIEREISVKSTTFSAVLEEHQLLRVDWLKVDLQGTDLRLIKSLPDDVRNHLLAADVEPGLINAYIGEDLFTDVHEHMTNNGFWLSDIKILGAGRMRRSTVGRAATLGLKIDQSAELQMKTTPGWCEARYLRNLDSLSAAFYDKRDFTLLWAFAIMDNQFGFAADLAVAFGERFGNDSDYKFMIENAIALIRKYPSIRQRWRSKLVAKLPNSLKLWLKQIEPAFRG